MATYKNAEGEVFNTDLLNFSWSIMSKGEYEEVGAFEEYDELIEQCQIPLVLGELDLKNVVPGDTPDPIYEERCGFIELKFSYSEDDELKLNPIAEEIYYPLEDNELNGPCDVGTLELSDKEKAFFTKMLRESIGDHHTPEMQRVMIEYHDAVDPEIRRFVRDVVDGDVDVTSVTVGFTSSNMARRIEELTGVKTEGNRIVMTGDDIRHILNRHGPNGTADKSLADLDDIARIWYILANYDTIECDGGKSSLYRLADGAPAPQVLIKKRIDGEYYVVTVASDSKKKRNAISSARIVKSH